MTPNTITIPSLIKRTRPEPVISALTGYPIYPFSIDCSPEEWANDPRFSVEHFKQFGGLEAVAEVMRSNLDELDMMGVPASLLCYRDFLCNRASLVGNEKEEVYSKWAADPPEGVPTFDKVESYILSAASFAKKLSAMQSANLLMEKVMAPRREKEREERDRRNKEYMNEQARAPFKKEIDRTKGAQAGADRAYNELRLKMRDVEKERNDFRNAYAKAVMRIEQLKAEIADLRKVKPQRNPT